MNTKTLKERRSGRSKNIALQCAKDAMNNPGKEIPCFDHEHSDHEQHLRVASMASGVLTALGVKHDLLDNMITVKPYV